MNIRFSRWATGMLTVAAVVLMSGRSWAIYHMLNPDKDEYKLKYDVEVSPAEGDKVNVVFTVADEGRLKPFYSATVVAFSKPDSTGGRTYDVKAPIELKKNKDGQLVGQTQIRKEFVDRAQLRILTLSVDGKRQTAGAAYYDIPLKKYLDKNQMAPAVASPPSSKVTK